MPEETNLPGLPATVDLGGPAINVEGDPLAFMQNAAREAIDSISKNAIVDEPHKVEFKKKVLSDLKVGIDKMDEIDKQAAAKKEEEEANKTEENASEEEDPFADIFGDEETPADEYTQEKIKIAQDFVSNLKLYKEKFLREMRIKKETEQKQKDEKALQNLLGKLDSI